MWARFLPLWSKFRGTIYFRILYLLLIAVVGALSLASAVGCVALVLIPVLTLLIPHWFGERRFKHHALNGAFMLGLVSILFAAILTPGYVALDEFVLSEDRTRLDLSDGIVRPYRTDPGPRAFNFTVTMWTNDSYAANFRVHVRVFSLVGFNVANESVDMIHDRSGGDALSDGSFADGERFYAEVPLEPFVHSYGFGVVNGSGLLLAATPNVPGPFHAEYSTYFALWLYNGFFTMIFVIVGFYLLLLLYWWTRKAREIRGSRGPDRGRKRDEGGGEYTCTNCGGDVSESDTKCPNCGAEFGPGPESREPADAKT